MKQVRVFDTMIEFRSSLQSPILRQSEKRAIVAIAEIERVGRSVGSSIRIRYVEPQNSVARWFVLLVNQN